MNTSLLTSLVPKAIHPKNEPTPITPAILARAKALGVKPERIPFLLACGKDYEYREDGSRIEPEKYHGNPLAYLKTNINHHMIKPDPKGVFYFKIKINGKSTCKPLAKDEETSRVMRDKILKDMNWYPSGQEPK